MKKTLPTLVSRPAAPLALPAPPSAAPRRPWHSLGATLAMLGVMAAIGLVSSRPAHTAGGPIAVNVANVPLPTIATDNPAKQPFQVEAEITSNGASVNVTTVPAGKRLVIESINAFSNLQNDSHSHNISLYSPGISIGSAFLEFNIVPNTTPYAAVSQNTLFYAEAGQPVSVFVQTSGNFTPDVIVTLSGYLVDVP